MIIAATGHRPNKLGGYDLAVFNRLVDLGRSYLRRVQPTKTISGMALGWDQAFARASYLERIPFIAAVPFAGQEGRWPYLSEVFYRELLSHADEVVVVCDGGYHPKKMQIRNEWMVDHCDKLAALYDGTAGGTRDCIMYAERREKPIDNLWNEWKGESK